MSEIVRISPFTLTDVGRRWRMLSKLDAEEGRWPQSVSRELAYAYQFYTQLIGADRRPIVVERVAAEYPDIYLAYQAQTDTSDIGIKWILEACLFAGQPVDDIAKRVALTPAAIRWYEYLFMDIRPVLDYPALVLASDRLLGRALEGQIVGDRDLQWKLVAYTWGVDALFRYMNILNGLQSDDWQKVSNAIRQAFAIKSLHAGMLVTPSQYNAIELGDHHVRREQQVFLAQTGANISPSHSLVEGLIVGIRGTLGIHMPLTLQNVPPPPGVDSAWAEPRLAPAPINIPRAG